MAEAENLPRVPVYRCKHQVPSWYGAPGSFEKQSVQQNGHMHCTAGSLYASLGWPELVYRHVGK